MTRYRWRKLGQIFDPANVTLPSGCIEFAQAPQALVFPDFVRVYFSTRSIDADSGKFRSHIAFGDLDRSLSTVLRVSREEAVPLGDLGCFDEHGIFPMNVLRHEGRLYGYTCGWSRRRSVSVETAIGLVESDDDGVTFRRLGPGPVLGPTLHEPYLVGDAHVRVIGGTFHMWYIFGTAWTPSDRGTEAERTYKIGHTTSPDGVTWVPGGARQIIEDVLGPDECQALPSVIDFDGRYHMFFCYRSTFGFRSDPSRGYRIGHASSDDLETWIRDDQEPALEAGPDEWDRLMQCYPNVFELDGRVYLLYNGNAFGRHGFGAAVLES